jgi:predicted DNA binding protein
MMATSDEPYLISIEIENERCELLRTFNDVGIPQFQVIDIRDVPDGHTRHLLRLSPRQIEKVPKHLLKKIEKRVSDTQMSAWFETQGCDVCNTIVAHGSFLISGRSIEGNTLIYQFITPSFTAFQKIISKLENLGFSPRILEVGKYQPKGFLTEKQERVLWFALRMGYFEYPRRINSIELSKKLGIAPSTLSEIVRRGMRRLLEYHFES